MRTCPNLLKPLILSGPRVKVISRPIPEKKNRKTFGPQEVNRFSQLCAKFQPPGGFELHATIFKKTKTMAPEVQCNLGLYVFERFSGCLAKILKKNICFYHVTLNRQIFWPNDILYKFWKNFYAEICLVNFFGGILWVSWNRNIFISENLIFTLSMRYSFIWNCK